ncbi:ABC transporter permease [Rhizohabitans arisaemae]|uniref:ABC transporter permease n=1 Tax=Rhizohabitans arisaemae TaxID=2720610 RepID=UPI0024B27B59|nr:FtsX-like permease family protein [Rhizohabitans arisaemae]
MGRTLLVFRLAARDLRRRPAEAVLLLLALTAATATLTLGLILNGVISEPYQSTREATAGPDVIASLGRLHGAETGPDPAALKALTDAPGVVAHSGPYLYTQAALEAGGVTVRVWAQGRHTSPADVDQPKVTEGNWVRDGGAVLEAGLAQALGASAGDRITLGGRSFQVAGVAVTAAMPPYPKVCYSPCRYGAAAQNAPPPPIESLPPTSKAGPPPGAFWMGASGLIWLSEADAQSFAKQTQSLGYLVNLKLADPAGAATFVRGHFQNLVTAPSLATWQDVFDGHMWLIEAQRTALMGGTWLLGLIALGSIAVLVGGRMTDQLRRVGLLKAVGGTPGLVAAVLLAEHVAVALLATVAGLVTGWLAAPLLTEPGAALLGSAATPAVTPATAGLVAAVALGIAGLASFVPAVRAARTSTVRALADVPRPPRRAARLIAISARLPVPLLLAVRAAARRPRRTLLAVAGVAVSVTGIVAALSVHADRYAEKAPGTDPRTGLSQALLMVAIMLVVQAAVNAICIIWATTLDARRSSALARALGATPDQVSAGLAAAQALPALAGALLGLAGGIGLAEVLNEDAVVIPPPWQLAAVILGAVAVVTALTAVPARIGARRSVGEILRTEAA